MVAQFVPASSSLTLPLVKLPVGYYRDVFINAVYDSLSALSLAVFTTSVSIFPSLLKSPLPDVLIFCFPVCPSLCSLLHLSFPSGSLVFSLISLCRNLIILLISSASRRQRDLPCKSHCTELIPNLLQSSNGLHSISFLNLGVYNAAGPPSSPRLGGSELLFSHDE